jgi:hypothetical protein
MITEQILPTSPHCVNGYWSWIRSPETNAQLQIDLLFLSITDSPFSKIGAKKLAIEIQGEQHVSWEKAKFFYKRKKDWEYLKRCDAIKELACKENKIPLIHINHDDPIDRESLTLAIRKALKV